VDFIDTQLGLDALAYDNDVTDIEVAKASEASLVDPTGVEEGYRITVTNLGPNNATSVTIRDTMPSRFDLVSATPSVGECNDVQPTTTCILGDLAVGDSATIDIVAVPNVTAVDDTIPSICPQASSAGRRNSASLFFMDQTDSDPTNSNGAAGSPGRVTVTGRTYAITVDPSARQIAATGDTLTYTVTVVECGGAITGDIALSCVDITGNVSITCTFDPAAVNTDAGGGEATATLSVAVGSVTASLPPSSRPPSAPLYAVWLGMPFVAFFGMRAFGGKRAALAVAMLALLVLSLLPLAGCNESGQGSGADLPAGITSFRVQGTIGASEVVTFGFNSVEVE
jgi:uncharacterized repeat protein (TIGR01451 family)